MKSTVLVITCLAGVMYLAARGLFCLDVLEYTGVPGALALLALGGAVVVLGCQLINARRVARGKTSWPFLTSFLIFLSFMSLMFVCVLLGFLECMSNAGERPG